MKVAIVRVGSVEDKPIAHIEANLPKAFPNATCTIIDEILSIPKVAYNALRRQYHSSSILPEVRALAVKYDIDKALGVTEVDLYVPRLNFVFGEAECPGRAALISLFRLKPEFYGWPSDEALFLERALKEAVHELGHTLGLGHCLNPTCIMFFSNSIIDTDNKRLSFCKRCRILLT